MTLTKEELEALGNPSNLREARQIAEKKLATLKGQVIRARLLDLPIPEITSFQLILENLVKKLERRRCNKSYQKQTQPVKSWEQEMIEKESKYPEHELTFIRVKPMNKWFNHQIEFRDSKRLQDSPAVFRGRIIACSKRYVIVKINQKSDLRVRVKETTLSPGSPYYDTRKHHKYKYVVTYERKNWKLCDDQYHLVKKGKTRWKSLGRIRMGDPFCSNWLLFQTPSL